MNHKKATGFTPKGDARHRRGICTFTNGAGGIYAFTLVARKSEGGRKIEKTITAKSFDEAVAPLKELAAEMLGVNQRSFALATV